MKSELTRTRIRVAAAKVIERDGAGHLTLEKVAAEADLSKGGLLYHYPSKDALLQGLLLIGLLQTVIKFFAPQLVSGGKNSLHIFKVTEH